MSYDDSDNNNNDVVKLCDKKPYNEYGIVSAFLRLCNLSLVTFQCLKYKYNTDFL